MDKVSLIVREDGSIDRQGIDDGGSKLEIVSLTPRILVLKVGGMTGWAGIGIRRYYPTRFYVYRILAAIVADRLVSYRLERLTDFEPRVPALDYATLRQRTEDVIVPALAPAGS